MRASLFMLALFFAAILSTMLYIVIYYTAGITDVNIIDGIHYTIDQSYNYIFNIISNINIFRKETQENTSKLLNLNVKKLCFVNDTITIKTNFKPLEAYVKLSNYIYNLTFNCSNESCLAEFKPTVVGIYTVVADNISANFTVDSYSIEAKVINNTITGKVSWHYVMPKFIEYKILPIGSLSNKTKIINGTFKIPLINLPAGNYTALLRCGNAKLTLNFTAKGGGLVNFSI